MADDRWFNPSIERPTKGQVVDWISPSGEVVRGGKYETLWILPGGGMYVYYTPAFWRPHRPEHNHW